MSRNLDVRQREAHRTAGRKFWVWYVFVRPAVRGLAAVGTPTLLVAGLWSAVPHVLLGVGCAALAAACVAGLVARQLSMAATRARMMGQSRGGVSAALAVAALALLALALLIFRLG